MAAEDTEITLGTGKLLGLFFMLALTCGLFFAVGYSLGKTSAREQALKNQAAATDVADTEAENGKPATATGGNASSSKQATQAANAPAPDLTFYKAVKEDPRAGATPAQTQKASETAAVDTKKNALAKPNEPLAESDSAAEKKTATAASTQSSPQASPGGTYLVQIAAVSHEEDAAALAGALRKKSYAASVVNSPTGKDKLFHVVLGPYASLPDAQAMKAKLEGEGYSPIVKR